MAGNSKLPYKQYHANSKLLWQTASYFDKQQVMLTNSKLFWQTASYSDKQQVILTNSR